MVSIPLTVQPQVVVVGIPAPIVFRCVIALGIPTHPRSAGILTNCDHHHVVGMNQFNSLKLFVVASIHN